MKPAFDSYMQETVARNLVKWIAGQYMTCPRCDDIMDCKQTVVLTDTADHTIAMCAKCYGKPAGSFTSGSVTVYDGRTLWKPAKNVWRFKEAVCI